MARSRPALAGERTTPTARTLGSSSRADADFVSAGRLFSGIHQELEAAYVVHNRAEAAFAAGSSVTE